MDANMDCGSIGLFSLDTLNVDDILLPVDLHHFANLLAFVVSTDNLFVNKAEFMSAPECHFTWPDPVPIGTALPGLRHLCGWA